MELVRGRAPVGEVTSLLSPHVAPGTRCGGSWLSGTLKAEIEGAIVMGMLPAPAEELRCANLRACAGGLWLRWVEDGVVYLMVVRLREEMKGCRGHSDGYEAGGFMCRRCRLFKATCKMIIRVVDNHTPAQAESRRPCMRQPRGARTRI